MGLLLPTFRGEYRLQSIRSNWAQVFTIYGSCLYHGNKLMGPNTYFCTLKLLWEIISWDISLIIGVELLQISLHSPFPIYLGEIISFLKQFSKFIRSLYAYLYHNVDSTFVSLKYNIAFQCFFFLELPIFRIL